MDRHGLSPRDDKNGAFTMKGMKRLGFSLCHCEEGTQVTDTAIHRVLGDAGGVVCSVIEHQWIATGYALAMTRLVFLP